MFSKLIEQMRYDAHRVMHSQNGSTGDWFVQSGHIYSQDAKQYSGMYVPIARNTLIYTVRAVSTGNISCLSSDLSHCNTKE